MAVHVLPLEAGGTASAGDDDDIDETSICGEMRFVPLLIPKSRFTTTRETRATPRQS